MSRCNGMFEVRFLRDPARARNEDYRVAPHSQYRTRQKLLVAGNDLQATHIALQHFRHGDRAVLLLVGFHDSDQRAADRGAGTVEGVHEARLAVGPAIARIHAPCLEIAAYRAARDLAVSAAFTLPRH